MAIKNLIAPTEVANSELFTGIAMLERLRIVACLATSETPGAFI